MKRTLYKSHGRIDRKRHNELHRSSQTFTKKTYFASSEQSCASRSNISLLRKNGQGNISLNILDEKGNLYIA